VSADAIHARLDEHGRLIEQLLSDRATLRMAVRELARLRRAMPKLADETAALAVERAFATRDEKRRGTWSFRAQMAGVAIGAVGVGAGLTHLF
jgi:CRP-like cAMP-binding protein